MRKLVFVLCFLAAAILAANAAYFWFIQQSAEHEQEPAKPVSKSEPVIIPPPLESLGHGTRMPSPEELEEESRYDDLQVSKASEWLNDANVDRRVAGVEQLSAFPTPESERMLITTLGLDFDPEVRRVSAQALSVFKKPSEKAVAALLAALQDDSDSVQIEALNTLMLIAGKMENGSEPLKRFFSDLSARVKSKRLKAVTRHALRAFLLDQKPPSLTFGPKK